MGRRYRKKEELTEQGSFFGIRIHFLASEGGSLHKYTNQSQSLRILQPEKRTRLQRRVMYTLLEILIGQHHINIDKRVRYAAEQFEALR
jgi:hypothetical protein